MHWDDVGYLIYKNRFNENSIIAEFYTKNHGKFSGVIFGGTSKRIKNFLQIGNKLHLNYNYKSESKSGYFKIEILKANTPLYFSNKKKLLCINNAMNLIKLLTAESQQNTQIFISIDDFFEYLKCTDWLKKYIFWELKILELLGYNIDFDKYINSEVINDKKKYFFKSNNLKKYIPNFLVDHDITNIDDLNFVNGLNFISEYMKKNILQPNNIIYPNSRLDFINLFK